MGYLDQEKNSPEEYTVPQQCGAADRSTNRKLFNYEKLRDLHPLSLPFATFSVKSRFFMFFCSQEHNLVPFRRFTTGGEKKRGFFFTRH